MQLKGRVRRRRDGTCKRSMQHSWKTCGQTSQAQAPLRADLMPAGKSARATVTAAAKTKKARNMTANKEWHANTNVCARSSLQARWRARAPISAKPRPRKRRNASREHSQEQQAPLRRRASGNLQTQERADAETQAAHNQRSNKGSCGGVSLVTCKRRSAQTQASSAGLK